MTESNQPPQQMNFDWRTFLMYVLAAMGTSPIEKFGLARFPLSLFISITIASLIEYWVPPRPLIKFPIWASTLLFRMSCAYIVGWLVPGMISPPIPQGLAYGFMIFLALLNSYWLPALSPSSEKINFKKYLMFCVLFALFVGIAMHVSSFK